MLQPLGNRVLVEPSEAEEKSPGGILLPESAQEKPAEGKVIAVGPGKLLDDGTRAAMSVKEGDVVIYRKYGGTDVTVDGEEYVIIEEDSLLAIRS